MTWANGAAAARRGEKPLRKRWPEPGDPDMLGTVLARYGRVTQRLVLFAASRDENGIPKVEAAGWRR